jgi:hypothetical protein
VVSPVEELHSLNLGIKVKEYSRIDEENERIINKLSATSVGVDSLTELTDRWEHNKKIFKMISRKDKIGVDQVAKLRNDYLKKTYSSRFQSKLESTSLGEDKVNKDSHFTTSKDTRVTLNEPS